MIITIEDLERQMELLALAIYDKKPNSLHNWAHDYLSLLDTIRNDAEAEAQADADRADQEAAGAHAQYEAECRDRAEYEAREERDEEAYYNSEGE